MTDLKVTQQTLENQQILLSIEVPDERVNKAMRAVAKRLAKQVRIPGFRPGKAPYHVVVQRFGREALMEEAADELGNKVFPEALESAGLEPYAQATLKEIAYDPLTYRVEVPMPPETDAGDYRSVRVPFEEPSEEEIAELVQEQIDQMRARHQIWAPSDEPIEFGDLVTISIRLTVDGELVLENDDWDFIPDEEDYTLTPEFDTAFIGMNVGEPKGFTATFPEHGDSAWPGEEGQFEVEVKGVKRRELPELDDELAQEIGEYETAEQLIEETDGHMRQHKLEEAESALQEKVVEALIEGATLAYPPAAVEMELDGLMSEQESMFKSYGFQSLDAFLEMSGRTMDEYRQSLRPAAESRLKRQLVFDAIAGQEQFPVNDYEMQQFLTQALGHDEEMLEQYLDLLANSEGYREYISEQVKRNKVNEFVLALARGEDVPAPGEHVSEEAPEPEPEVETEPEVEEQAAVETEAEPESDTDEVEPESEAASQSETDEEVTLAESTTTETEAEDED